MLTYLDALIGFAVVMLMISLLITLLTQIVSTALNHRGSNLRWGLKTLFANIDPKAYPQLKANAGMLANEVLRHCLISDSWFSNNVVAHWFGSRMWPLKKLFDRFRLATAIRPTELADILQQLTVNPTGDIAALPAATATELANNIRAMLSAGSPSAVRDLSLVSGAVAAAVPAIGNPASLIQGTVSSIRDSAGDLEAWFSSIMDRVTQRFVMYMRIWTVLFGCCFAFGTGLNSIALMDEMYHNSTLRSTFTGMSQQVTTMATTILDPQNNLSAALTSALNQGLQDADVTTATPPPAIQTRVEGDQWIRANAPADQVSTVLKDFHTAADAATQTLLQNSSQEAAKVADLASTSGFNILEARWPHKPSLGYIVGVICTAGLLSLGAPFWFNALKAMTNLRPIVASKSDSEKS